MIVRFVYTLVPMVLIKYLLVLNLVVRSYQQVVMISYGAWMRLENTSRIRLNTSYDRINIYNALIVAAAGMHIISGDLTSHVYVIPPQNPIAKYCRPTMCAICAIWVWYKSSSSAFPLLLCTMGTELCVMCMHIYLPLAYASACSCAIFLLEFRERLKRRVHINNFLLVTNE